MKKFLLAVFVVCSFLVNAQETFITNGSKNNIHNYYAFKNATIFKDYQTKIEDKFKQALIAIDDDRLKQEFLIFIQKMDIDEELNRITSHIDEVRRLLKTDGAIGKKLDFMMQELNREANTLGSKSISPKTSQISVDLKVLIEQMREQIQNIE